MADSEQDIEKVILTRLMYLNASIAGVITGIVLGCGVFFATMYLILKGGEVVGPHLSLLGQYLYGYKVTFTGSLIGLAYGFGIGFIVGYVVARLYNWFASLRDKSHAT
jgi:hypothetical protein